MYFSRSYAIDPKEAIQMQSNNFLPINCVEIANGNIDNVTVHKEQYPETNSKLGG